MKSFFDKIKIDEHFSGQLSDSVSNFILKYYNEKFIYELLNNKKITRFVFDYYLYKHKLPKVINNEKLTLYITDFNDINMEIENWILNRISFPYAITEKIKIENIFSESLYFSSIIKDYDINFNNFDLIKHGSQILKKII